MKPKGSILALVVLFILFWPVGIAYAITRDWSGGRQKIEK